MAKHGSKKEVEEYIRKQINSGYDVDNIVEHLVKHGHSREEIDKIIDHMIKEEERLKSKTAYLSLIDI
ncbi:MAG: hypothetical protein N3D84_02835, partial [Candidatus Woesearchaeota archaeon]|nr:hypothetical protein [Candidatus Woesearchaeota archaeon]